MAWVYILRCKDNTLYTGCTTDLERRIRQHESGKGAKYTRGRAPLHLVYSEQYETLSQAQKREKVIQSLDRSQKLDLIENHPPK